ncbi:MAG TPA: EAL domain-containing protein [Candidatus Limnocylindrales bacterium]
MTRSGVEPHRPDPSARRLQSPVRGHRTSQAADPATEAASALQLFVELMSTAPIVAFVKDVAGRYIYANPHLLASFADRMGRDWYGRSDADIWPPEVAAQIRANDLAAIRGGTLQAFSQAMPYSDGVHDVLVMKFPLVAADRSRLLAGVGIDVTERQKTTSDRDRLATAIDQASESVVITDLDARVTYVNPAFERLTGYLRTEVIGQNPRLLKSGLQSRTFYDAMWAALSNGLPWVADFVNRRRDGTLFAEESVISPIRDSASAITGYVAVSRDVTHERALEQRSAELARERALIAETLRSLRSGDAPEATARAICRQVAGLTGITAAQLFVFDVDGLVTPLGIVVQGHPDPLLQPPPAQRSQHLRERAAQGPWIEPCVDGPGHPYDAILGPGEQKAAYAPIRYDGGLLGVLVIHAAGSVDDTVLTDSLPALVEFADLAGAVLGRVVAERTEVRRGADHIRAIIGGAAFAPVFQPIVDLARDTVLGYEALTRFTDGMSPDARFGEAFAVGLGTELEVATLGAALDAADGLPAGAWLNVNVSPALLVAGKPLRKLMRGRERHLVLEVTEHVPITDYGAFRSALAALGPNVRLAVDDAGAGFASLRHILELRPAFVKLDRWLVAGLESDAARRAMIVGLQHFARATGCRLIAEGIETEAELKALRSLGIRLGQGYLLGRPMPAEELRVARPPDRRPENARRRS